MSIIYMTITISLILAIIFLIAFIWTVKNGQYEDDYSPSVRMLFEDKKPKEKENESTTENTENTENTNKTNKQV